MRSKKIGDKYRIHCDFSRFPKEVGIKETEEVLKKTEKSINDFYHSLKEIRDEHQKVYDIISSLIAEKCSMFLCDEESLLDLKKYIEEIREELENNDDDVPAEEEIVNLRDKGFKRIFGYEAVSLWEKVLEDTDEREVVEEISIRDGEIYNHRKRTTLWEKTEYGRASKNIDYEDMPINEELRALVRNTTKLRN